MKMKRLTKAERSQSRVLWEQVFTEDGEAFLNYYYQRIADHNEIYGIQEEGALRSMLHLDPYPVQVGNTSCVLHYIVAVATEASYRRRGYMGALLRTSMQEMNRRGEPFTFLMPEAERIYLPYDFVTVCGQQHSSVGGLLCDNGIPSIEGYETSYAKPEDFAELAVFVMRVLAEQYQVYTIRDRAYYERIVKEQESRNGGIVLVKQGGRLVGCFLAVNDKKFMIQELIVSEGYEEIRAKLMLRTEAEPKIMVRIINLQALLQCMTAEQPFDMQLEISDPILPGNTGLFRLIGTREGIQCSRLSHEVHGDRAVPIAKIAEELFLEGSDSRLQGVRHLQPLLFNEIV